jgi:hypothetical protein
MLRRGVPEWMADALNEYARAHSGGYSDFTTDDVEQLTAAPPPRTSNSRAISRTGPADK